MKNFAHIFLILNLFQQFSFSQQQKIDSLFTLIKADKEDTNKLNHLNSIAGLYIQNNPGSSIVFLKQALLLAEKILVTSPKSKAINLSAKLNMVHSFVTFGNGYIVTGDYPQALTYYIRALKISEELGNKQLQANSLSNIGSVYRNQGNYPDALGFFLRALKINEELKSKENIAATIGNIGIVYYRQQDLSKALDYYSKYLKLAEELDNKLFQSIALGNIGIVYNEKNDYQQALNYFFKALKIDEELGNKIHIAVRLTGIGNVYADQAEIHSDPAQSEALYNSALEHYLRALKIVEELGTKNRIASVLGNIGSINIEMATKFSLSAFKKEKLYKEAHGYLFRSLSIDAEVEALDNMKEDYMLISFLYEKSTAGLPDSANGKILNKEEMRLRSLHYYKKYLALRDTIFSEENKKQLIQKEMNYDFEKKEALTKAEQDKKDAIAKQELKQKELQRNYFIVGFGLVALLSIFIFKSFRQKQKANILITEQKRLVDEHQKEILDSIRYAKRIQSALLPTEKYVARYLNSPSRVLK